MAVVPLGSGLEQQRQGGQVVAHRGEVGPGRAPPLEAGAAVELVDGMRAHEPVREPAGVGEEVPDRQLLAHRHVSGLVNDPLRHTRVSAKAGTKRRTGSFSSNAPSSHSIIAATEVIGLVME